MTIPSGWAEFNDATAVFRGRMVAATGTFSGTFRSDNVEAVQDINIRDGAVSAYYGFNFAAGVQSIEFTIPPQPYARVADIIAPMQMVALGTNAVGYVSVYKNGALIKKDPVRCDTYSNLGGKDRDRWIIHRLPLMQVVRFIDLNVSPSANNNYTIVLQNGSYENFRQADKGEIRLSFLGPVTVGCRKR